MPPSSTRLRQALALGVLLWEMFLTTPSHAAEPAEAAVTSPEGQVSPDLAPGPAVAPAAPPAQPVARRVPPDPDIQAAPTRLGPGGELRLHGGLHDPVVGATIAFDWAFRRASIGAGVDYGAWIDPNTLKISPGALGVFALVAHRIPLGRINLRQRIGVGPAIALGALGSRKAGSVGLFFEVAPLGLEIQTRVRRLAFTFDGFSLAISAPVLGKEQVAMYQYRVAVGIRF